MVFDNKHDAKAVCRELRNLCPRNAEVINIEGAQERPSSRSGPADVLTLGRVLVRKEGRREF
jgi:hypothetical protein